MMVTSHLKFPAVIIWCVVTLLLSAPTVARTEAACSAQEAVSFKFSVTSRRNETRHRIVTVDLVKDTPTAADGRNSRSHVTLDVNHEYSECGGVERVHVGTVASARDPTPHRQDYELFPGVGYYKLHTTGQTWEDALRTCLREHAHLIDLNSDREADVVKQMFSRNPAIQGASNSDYYYMGFHDKFVDGQYITVTGQPLNYTRWAVNNPKGGASINYGGMDRTGLIHDIYNVWKLAFVCEEEL